MGHETEEQVLGRDPDKSKNNLEVSLQSHLSTDGAANSSGSMQWRIHAGLFF